MTDWRALSRAIGANFPESDLNRIVPVLESLESAFVPLTRTLDYTTEPVLVLSDLTVHGRRPEE